VVPDRDVPDLRHSLRARIVSNEEAGRRSIRRDGDPALKRDFMDLKREVLRMQHTLTYPKVKVFIGELKTPKSRRSVKLTAIAVARGR